MRRRSATFSRPRCLGIGLNRLAKMLVLAFALSQTKSAQAFLLPTSRSGVNISSSRSSREACYYNRVARRQCSRRSTTAICSTKHPPPALPSEPVDGSSKDNDDKKATSRREPTTNSTTNSAKSSSSRRISRSSSSSRSGSSGSNGNRPNASGRPRSPPTRSATSTTRPRTTTKGERSAGTHPKSGPPFKADPQQDVSDMNVLVPVQDVVPVLLADISQAAADSLGGGEAVRVSMERLSNTLEGVLRTEFSVMVDRADAGLLLGGRLQPKASRKASRSASKVSAVVASTAAASAKAKAGADAADPGDKGKRNASRWKRFRAWDRKDAIGGKRDGAPNTTTTAATTAAAAAGTRPGRLGGGDGKGRSNDDDFAEEELVPLLQLVEELTRSAMFSPISNRDVMMSQALAAEFPTAARVRPVFNNLANVYGLLHRSSGDENDESDGNGGKGKATRGGGKRDQVPFEGRLLVFRRGNGVEETKGRLLLKKLDYLQSNAVGWLSQSVTDTVKGWQEQVVELLDSFERGVTTRRDSVVRSCVEGLVAFGVERDTLARFIAAANETDIVSREREALDEAMEALRRNARGPVNLQRYGMRQVNVQLEEFSEGGAWPPGDDSWFWDSRMEAETRERGVRRGGLSDAGWRGGGSVPPENDVPSAVLPRVTLASVLTPRPSSSEEASSKEREGSMGGGKSGRWSASETDLESKSVLSRLLSKCTVKEPTYDEVVVVYIKRSRQSLFKPPPAVALVWNAGTRLSNRLRRVEKAEPEPESLDEVKSAGLGLQLRVYRGVPLVSLNAVTPDKKVEVRPQTALRLDLNSFVGLGLVLANLRFDSLVLVVAATASVVLLVVRTIVGYLNARIRVESFVSRDILDKTMGSNVPVLRYLAEEAAQQKSRHVVLVYAALLQCALNHSSSPGGTGDWGTVTAVSTASVARHCGAMMKACVGMPWEAKVDVPHWLQELESLKILVRTDEALGGRGVPGIENSLRSLPLALEGPETTTTAPKTTTTASRTVSTGVGGDQSAENNGGGSTIVCYHLLAPEAAVEELKLKWSDLVEPPGTAGTKATGRNGDSGNGVSEDCTPWARMLGVGSGGSGENDGVE